MKSRILIVDDEQDILDMLQYNLRKHDYNVIVAHNGKEALGLASLQPDLILLDIMMPGYDGWEVVRRLRSNDHTAGIPIIMLTARGGESDEVMGFELGADDYVQKPISPRILLARIKSILRRANVDGLEGEKRVEVEEMGLVIDRENYSVSHHGSELFFPRREFELLTYLVMNKGRVFSRQHLLSAVWGSDVYVVERTVDVHIRKIREKLGVDSKYIETVKGVGYRFREL